MYYVKVEGKTLSDLKHGLERHLKELNGVGEFTGSVVTNAKPKKLAVVEEHLTEVNVEEMEEVESPFTKSAPTTIQNSGVITSGELDSEGIPWIEGIHSSSKAKVKNGTYKIARGVDDATANAAKAKYRASAPVQAAPVYQAPVQHVQHINLNTPPVVTYQAPVQQAPVVAPPIPQMQQSGHTLESFKGNFAMTLAQLITNGKLTQDWVNSLKAHFGVAEIWQANEAQVAQVFDQLVQHGIVQRVG